ncbi:MAG: A/G-specific adenine glycosylase [Rhodobacteraceae bacterium]|nr:A/G-specific adenine glycosylase [Paracoccaceae bacterium]
MLDWYDRHARTLAWRISPSDHKAGVIPDPYRIWLSEVMLQQTTVATVTDYFHRFLARWPTVNHLAAAADGEVMGEWAGLGYYARARNLLKCARVVANDFEGMFPDTYDALLALPGIGPYTAAAIASIAFGRAETVMDGNVERVMARLYNIHTPLPAAKPELKAKATALTPQNRPGDYAQAVMDLGATICSPKSPTCGICPVIDHCVARSAGTAAQLPKKIPKKPKPTRYGIVYLARFTDGAWLLERRPDKGLLGGMLGWPGSVWGDQAKDAPPCVASWVTLPAEVRHTFTHFHLILTVKWATLSMAETTDGWLYLSKHQFRPSDLPTVMRKAYDLAAPCWHNSSGQQTFMDPQE